MGRHDSEKLLSKFDLNTKKSKFDLNTQNANFNLSNLLHSHPFAACYLLSTSLERYQTTKLRTPISWDGDLQQHWGGTNRR